MSGKRQLLSTTYHEAGHVVVGYRFGIRVGKKGVSIVPEDGNLGVAHMPLTFRNSPEFDDSDRMRLNLERQAICLFAGIEAQRCFNPRSVRKYHPSGDYENAVNLLSYVENNSDELVLDAYITFLRQKTRQIVKSTPVWKQIVAVATALMKRQRLSRVEAEAAIKSVMPNFRKDL